MSERDIFDPTFYLTNNPDVAAAGVDPFTHYMEIGWQESRDPNKYFSSFQYLVLNADVLKANLNPLTHYSLFGVREFRDPGAFFDTDFYLQQNVDVANGPIEPLAHFSNFGEKEDRKPIEIFDSSYYLSRNADVAAIVNQNLITAFEHFRFFGHKEGRDPSSSFNTDFYLNLYLDVAASNFTAFEHYQLHGKSEGRRPDETYIIPEGTTGTIEGVLLSETITGSTGNDTISGIGGNDFLEGRNGNDSILGGSGNDTLSGGQGADSLIGNSGSDRIELTETGNAPDTIFYQAITDGSLANSTAGDNAAADDGADTISSFTAGTGGDKISFKGSIFGSTGATASTIDFHKVSGSAGGTSNTNITDVSANTELSIIIHQSDLRDYAALQTFLDTTVNGILTNSNADQVILIAGIDTVDSAIGGENSLLIYDPDIGSTADQYVLANLGDLDISGLVSANFDLF